MAGRRRSSSKSHLNSDEGDRKMNGTHDYLNPPVYRTHSASPSPGGIYQQPYASPPEVPSNEPGTWNPNIAQCAIIYSYLNLNFIKWIFS